MAPVRRLPYISPGWRSFYGVRRHIGSLLLLLLAVNMVGGQIRYSIPEEMKKGSVIGNVAQDLGLDLKRLRSGRARIVTGENVHYTELQKDKGTLVVNERIDREQLCGDITPCSLSFEMILENPMELHRITVEVLDINDHAPVFPNKDKPISFEISESAAVEVRFPLQSAQDLDVGQNALQNYILSPNDNFILKQHSNPDGRKYVEMVLQKPLDRERQTRVPSKWESFCGVGRHIESLLLLLLAVNMVGGQIRYSIPEEMKKGSVIGNVAQDLGLDLKRLRSGRARIVTGENVHYTELQTDKGILVVNERIDREQLCGDVTITVEVLDINDHAPVFPNKDKPISFEISESAAVGVRFPLQSGEDLDVGQSALLNYILSPNDNFILKQHANPDGGKYVEMVLQKPLDRERHPHFSLKLIAVDGGTPQRSGTVNIDVTVLDANDNIPVFNQSVYKASVLENTKTGTSIITVNATDADSGLYGHITYSLSKMKGSVAEIFTIDENTGTIYVSGQIDYEKYRKYELRVEAKDHGGLIGTSKVIFDVTDVNDNEPIIHVMSFSSPLSEDATPGTTIAILNIKDTDSERNGQIKCSIDGKLPFKIESSLTNYYNLPSRSATVIVNVAVADSFPEVLSEFIELTHDKEYNDNLTFYLVLALAVVSFLFITCLVVIISVKIYRWRQSRILFHSNLPVIPYYPPRYSDTLGTATLPHVYNYEVTTDSRKSDCKFGRAGSQNVLIMDPSSTGTMQRMQSEKSILDEPDSPLEVKRKRTVLLIVDSKGRCWSI
uniref:Protocadherin gamma-B7-like n=1 Tax=Neolamprologus brichardi TaxID=32507 RepID=A0A3Q4MEQ5_NEOBR